MAGTIIRSVRLYFHKEAERSGADLTQSSSLLSEKPNASAGIFEEIQVIDFAEFLASLNSSSSSSLSSSLPDVEFPVLMIYARTISSSLSFSKKKTITFSSSPPSIE